MKIALRHGLQPQQLQGLNPLLGVALVGTQVPASYKIVQLYLHPDQLPPTCPQLTKNHSNAHSSLDKFFNSVYLLSWGFFAWL